MTIRYGYQNGWIFGKMQWRSDFQSGSKSISLLYYKLLNSYKIRSERCAFHDPRCVFSFQLKFISSTYFISQVVQSLNKKVGHCIGYILLNWSFIRLVVNFLLKKLDIALVPFSIKVSAANLPIFFKKIVCFVKMEAPIKIHAIAKSFGHPCSDYTWLCSNSFFLLFFENGKL